MRLKPRPRASGPPWDYVVLLVALCAATVQLFKLSLLSVAGAFVGWREPPAAGVLDELHRGKVLAAGIGVVLLVASFAALSADLADDDGRVRRARTIRTFVLVSCLAGAALDVASYQESGSYETWFVAVDLGALAVASVAAALALSRKRPRPSPA